MKYRKVIWTRLVIASVIETYVNNPSLPLREIGERFGMDQRDVSRIVTLHYLGPGTRDGATITKSSSINQLIHKTA